MAVDRFVYSTLEESVENQLVLKDFNLHLKWRYLDGAIHIDSEDKRVNFVESAMNTAYRYLKENLVSMGDFSLTVKSELDDESGIKYGLGSSAAVVTSVITAMLKKFLPGTPSRNLIFKLSSIAHVKTQGNGSGADIAASTYGGVLEYSSFQADWLLNQYKTVNSLTELIKKDWNYLSIKRIEIPEQIFICVGWTGEPASTVSLVAKILSLKETNEKQFKKFLKESEKAVDTFLQGLTQKDTSLIFKGIKLNRNCLASVGKNAGIEIETPLLSELSNLSEKFGGAGKLSGAGGGDCGIAFMPTEESAQQLVSAWSHANIKPLDILIYKEGAISINP